jgi:hypothetical protein
MDLFRSYGSESKTNRLLRISVMIFLIKKSNDVVSLKLNRSPTRQIS